MIINPSFYETCDDGPIECYVDDDDTVRVLVRTMVNLSPAQAIRFGEAIAACGRWIEEKP